MKLRTAILSSFALLPLGLAVAAGGCHSSPPPAAPAPAPSPSPAEPPPPPPPVVTPAPVTRIVPIRGVKMMGAQIAMPGEIEFAVGAATIRDTKNSNDVLNALLKILNDNTNVTKLRIEGHTDSDGSADFNQKLSESRAKAVVKWLTDKGIDAKRLNAVGCASRDPLAPNTTEENKQKNRRTEFDVEEIDGKPAPGVTAACAPNPDRSDASAAATK